MAASDYWKCEVCGAKAFYDASIDWETTNIGKDADYWVATDALMALCEGCHKTHTLIVQKRETP